MQGPLCNFGFANIAATMPLANKETLFIPRMFQIAEPLQSPPQYSFVCALL